MNLLLVDDSADSRISLAELLRLRGHAVRTAATVTEALTRLREAVPDVVLLDVILPVEGSSRQLTEALATAPEWARVKVILTTGLPSDEPLQWPQVVGRLLKPFGIEDVEAILEKTDA